MAFPVKKTSDPLDPENEVHPCSNCLDLKHNTSSGFNLNGNFDIQEHNEDEKWMTLLHILGSELLS